MKKTIFFITLFMSSMLFGNQNNSLSFGYKTSLIDYTNYYEDNSVIDNEKSKLLDIQGFYLGYLYKKNNKYGHTDIGFDGSLTNGDTDYYKVNTASSISQYEMYDLSISYSEHLLIKKLDLYIGIGLGYNVWNRNVSGNQLEKYSWISYKPKLGFKYKFKTFNLGLNYEYQSDLSSEMELDNLTFDLVSIIGHRVSFPVEYFFDNQTSFLLEYIYEKQSIGKSNVINNYYKPKSESLNQYLKLGFKYNF